MSQYHLHEGLLHVPEGWRDQTMNVFRLPGGNSNKDAAIILTRDYETTLDTATDYASAQQECRRAFLATSRSARANWKSMDARPPLLTTSGEATVVHYCGSGSCMCGINPRC